jgi:hypothetical protein
VTVFAGTRLVTAMLAAAVVAVAASQVSDAASAGIALALAAIAVGRSAGRGLAVAPAAVAAAIVGVAALPHRLAVSAAAAAVAVAGALVLLQRPEPVEVSEGWRVDELERLVEANAAAYPERVDEWRAYVEFLRAHAVDGVLPPGFDALVEEEFAPLLSGRA